MPCFYKRSSRSSGSRSPHCEHDTVKFPAFHIRATEPRRVIAGLLKTLVRKARRRPTQLCQGN